MRSEIPSWRTRRARVRAAPGRAIYFWHIPKTAGSSFQHHLYAWFPERLQCDAGDWDSLMLRAGDAIDRFGLFRGHFGAALETQLGAPTHRVTFLRDPVARTVSHYLHVRRTPEHPYHDRVSPQSLAAFLDDPANAHMIDDFQARYLVERDATIPTLCAGLDRAALERFALQTRFERAPLAAPARLREDAHRALARFACVGIAEQFRSSLAVFRTIFDRPAPDHAHRVNVAEPAEREPLDSGLVDAIRARTGIDRELHERAWNALLTDHRAIATHLAMRSAAPVPSELGADAGVGHG